MERGRSSRLIAGHIGVPPLDSRRFSAPVRICLAGEDLDWLGGRCIAAAIDLPTVVRTVRSGPCHESEYLQRVWSQLNDTEVRPLPRLEVSNAAPIAAGLSSSTSLTIALVKASVDHLDRAPLSAQALAAAAFAVEHPISGCGGMDQLVIANGGVALLDSLSTGEAPPGPSLPTVVGHANWPPALGIIVLDSQTKKSTCDHIASVHRASRRQDPKLMQYMHTAHRCADGIWTAFDLGRFEDAFRHVNRAHGAMRDLMRMSTDRLEMLRDIALQCGCRAVKLTGAGGGGALFALVPKDEAVTTARRLQTRFEALQYPARVIVAEPDDVGAATHR